MVLAVEQDKGLLRGHRFPGPDQFPLGFIVGIGKRMGDQVPVLFGDRQVEAGQVDMGMELLETVDFLKLQAGVGGVVVGVDRLGGHPPLEEFPRQVLGPQLPGEHPGHGVLPDFGVFVGGDSPGLEEPLHAFPELTLLDLAPPVVFDVQQVVGQDEQERVEDLRVPDGFQVVGLADLDRQFVGHPADLLGETGPRVGLVEVDGMADMGQVFVEGGHLQQVEEVFLMGHPQ